MGKSLARNVAVAGTWYRAGDRVGDQIPADVAEKITNEKVWQYDDEDEQPKRPELKSTTGAQLTARVAVAGTWYGPGDDVPDDVARLITNPKVWEGGKAPSFDTGTREAEASAGEQPAGNTAGQAQTDEADTAPDDDADADRRPARRGRRSA